MHSNCYFDFFCDLVEHIDLSFKKGKPVYQTHTQKKKCTTKTIVKKKWETVHKNNKTTTTT